jgi:antitoxin VapB
MIAIPLETEQLARLLALKSGRTPEEVVKEAIEVRAREAGVPLAEHGQASTKLDLDKLRAIVDRCAALPLIDPRPPDEIIDYDEFGVPR